MWAKIKEYWEDIKSWFKYSETILWARIQTISGLIIAGIASVDWTQLTVSGLSKETLLLAGALIANGIFTECLRRRNSNL